MAQCTINWNLIWKIVNNTDTWLQKEVPRDSFHFSIFHSRFLWPGTIKGPRWQRQISKNRDEFRKLLTKEKTDRRWCFNNGKSAIITNKTRKQLEENNAIFVQHFENWDSSARAPDQVHQNIPYGFFLHK